ncbi:MAG: outer membrane protein assembly factor BamC [Pseudomonadota bacterium]|nr:hypothetical protein [Pseudomonadales bacterium]MDY6920059.1 outer membrane protein assembly factor BamC [Pseudomonadota bacterium]
MQILRPALLFLALIALPGCSYLFGEEGQFRERAMDYKKAQSHPPLAVPEGMESRPLQQRYPIPAIGEGDFYRPQDSDSVPRPQSLRDVNEAAGLELREDAGRVWLVVERPRGELWPQLREFAATVAAVDQADPGQGVIETSWMAPRQAPDEKGFWYSVGQLFSFSQGEQRDRFRFTVEAVPQAGPDTNLVRINHVRVATPTPAQVDWPAQPDSPGLVAAVYDELMLFLEDGGRKVGSSVLSQDLRVLPKYTMTRDGNGYPILVINQDFNRAWLAVGQALADAELEVTDLDRSLGIYYLEQTATVEDEERQLQLRLVTSESGIQVSVQVDDDTLAPQEQSARVLNRLRASLE